MSTNTDSSNMNAGIPVVGVCVCGCVRRNMESRGTQC